MSTPSVCKTCGAVLTPDASTAGLCPACLLARALSEDELEPAGEAESSDLAAGASFGPFEIAAVLGRGGMATVYRARETTLQREVALKVLPSAFLHDESFARRFQREARVVAALEHPHIVPLYASGVEDGVPWMSMRLLAGSLQEVIAGGQVTVERTVRTLGDIASALDYAHARGVVHRDVKPTNILIDRAGHACVGDFGLAHMVERHVAATRTGVITGTPHNMAPEQALGKAVDHRADIYSLGVVAYEMMTGRPPFDGDSPVAVLMKHASDPLPVPSTESVPPAAFAVIRRALAKDPTERWPTASAFAAALEASLAVPASRRGMSARIVWAAGLAAVAIIGALLLRPPPPVGEPEPAPSEDAIIVQPAADPVPAPPSPGPLPAPTEPVPPTTRPLATPASTTGPPAPRPAQSRPPRAQVTREPLDPSPPALTVAETPSVTPRETLPAANAAAGTPAVTPPVEPPDAALPLSKPAVAQPEPSTNTSAPGAAAAPRSTPPPPEAVTEPVRVHTVNPTYPPVALAAGIEGDVVLEAVVSADGAVTAVEVLRSPHALLSDAAREAVRQYRYTPGHRNGVPETFRVQETVRFSLK
ncbi:MAG: TonB family protein [Acidobacteriota bacterium]